MIEAVPKAFVDIEIHKDLSRDILVIRCPRTGLQRTITGLEMANCPELPPSNLGLFGGWLQQFFLDKPIYLARKPR